MKNKRNFLTLSISIFVRNDLFFTLKMVKFYKCKSEVPNSLKLFYLGMVLNLLFYFMWFLKKHFFFRNKYKQNITYYEYRNKRNLKKTKRLMQLRKEWAFLFNDFSFLHEIDDEFICENGWRCDRDGSLQRVEEG